GGGAVLDKKNRKRLKKRGLVVYLRASIEQQIDRTARDRHRPLLQNGNPEQTIKDLMVVREPLYLEVADVVIDTNRRNPKSVSNEIIKQIKIHQQSPAS
ncbi:MAG: shikimate kinase, partial [Pseudomonadota bacterium]|nr:shikimate kinase [Pseudomonadota bacterium]